MSEPVQVSIDIDAPPERIYDLVADLPGMGRWSPENTGGSWLDGATDARAGARFRGKNRRGPLRWSTICTITEAERGKVIEWTNKAVGLAVARWRYEFTPTATGTTVVESFEDRRGKAMKFAAPIATGVRNRDTHNTAGMEVTLQRLKAAAEAG